MNAALALLRQLADRGVHVELVGDQVRQLSGPPLSQAALSQLAKYAHECSGADAPPIATDVHVVVNDADLSRFFDAVTSSPIVGVSVVGGTIAVTSNGSSVELITGSTATAARRQVESLLEQLDTNVWDGVDVAGAHELRITAEVLERAGVLRGDVRSLEAAAKAAGVTSERGRTNAMNDPAGRARTTWRLAASLRELASKLGLDGLVALEERVASILRRAGGDGFALDVPYWREMVARARHSLDYHDRRVRERLGVSFNDEQLLERLHERGHEVASTKTVDLKRVADEYEVIADIVAARRASAFAVQVGEPWLRAVEASPDGRLHPVFHANGETARISSTVINIMGLPREPMVRCGVVSSSGQTLIEFDYRASQLRIVASLHRVEALRRLFNERQDPHSWMAARYFRIGAADITDQQRAFGKVTNFASLYGVGVPTFVEIASKHYGLHLRSYEAAELLTTFFDAYPEIADWHEGEWRVPTSSFTTPLGRRLWIGRPRTSYNGRLAAPIQAIEADALKSTMLAVDDDVRAIGGRLVTPIHDALLYSVPDGEVLPVARLVRDRMRSSLEDMIGVRADIDVKAGRNWGSLRPLKVDYQ